MNFPPSASNGEPCCCSVMMIVLLILGKPLAYLTGFVAMFFAIGWFGPNVLPLLTSRIYSFVSEYTLIAVPMFVLMASLLDRTNIAKDLYNAMQFFGGRIRGGVAGADSGGRRVSRRHERHHRW